MRLWFTDTGGTGEPIVLMHAITGTSESWETQVAAFSKAGYRVIAFDRRGWGRARRILPPALSPDTPRTIFRRSPIICRSDESIWSVWLVADSSRSTTRRSIRKGCRASWLEPALVP